MYFRFPLIFLLFVSTTFSVWRGCGDTCDNSNQCNDALCSLCDQTTRTCLSGRPCNSSCVVDSDCERLRYCYLCTNGVCSPGPLYPYQCVYCNTDQDCSSPACDLCALDLRSGTKRCSAGCGGSCLHNYECGYGTKCSRCDFATRTCQPGNVCGSRCGNNGDCDQTSTCKECIDFVCSVPCGQPCQTNDQCNSPVTGCGLCSGGICIPGVNCGSICIYDRDCEPAAPYGCTICVNGKCAKKGCNSTCETSDDCVTAGECKACTNGKCSSPLCGSQCEVNQDCSGAGLCVSCYNGYCNYTQCSSFCITDSDCTAAPVGCQQCISNKCGHRTCFASCQTNNDCALAYPCTSCVSGSCIKPLPPYQCDLNSPCQAGNNNECPQTTCSRCDPFTNTCRLGGPCDAGCIVDTDCDQTGLCTICRNVCTTVENARRIDEQAAERQLSKDQSL